MDENTWSPDDPQYRITPTQQMLAACTGALITSLVVTPFDVVKIRLQSQKKTITNKKFTVHTIGLMDHLCPVGDGKVDVKQCQVHFKGTIDAFNKIVRTEGITSLWSGLSPTLCLSVPATVAYFTLYENFRLFIKDMYDGHQPHWAPMCAGSAARFCSVTLVSPLELIKTKMQSKKVTYQQLGVAVKDLVHYYGYRGLFKGLSSTLLRDVPFSGIYWFQYEFIKKHVGMDTNPNFAFSFLAGAFSGSVAALFTTPFDVVKTYQQIELGEKIILSTTAKKSSSTFTVMSDIVRQSGFTGLFTGIIPRLVKIAPACAIMISTFEYGKHFFLQYNHNYMSRLRSSASSGE